MFVYSVSRLNFAGSTNPILSSVIVCFVGLRPLTITEYFNNEAQNDCVEICKISTASTIQKNVQQVLFVLSVFQSGYFLCLKHPIIGGIYTEISRLCDCKKCESVNSSKNFLFFKAQSCGVVLSCSSWVNIL